MNLPDVEAARKVFRRASRTLKLDDPEEDIKRLVIYNMTDGMRTSTSFKGSKAYVDGGMFVLRLIHLLKNFGATSCYVNVIEERHRKRENYESIYDGLVELYPIYRDYAAKNQVRLEFLGDLTERIDPSGRRRDFAKALSKLETETEKHKAFRAFFLINYSLDWAMANLERFSGLPQITEVVRHTKFQLPTGMMLPPAISDYGSFVYVQQGSSSLTWSDAQLSCLIAISLRSMLLNQGTQYLKRYGRLESATIRAERELRGFMRHSNLFQAANRTQPPTSRQMNTKRAIIAGPTGPEVYEF